MSTIADYQVLEQLHDSNNSRVYRAIRKQDSLPVILKVLNEDTPSTEKRVRFQQEYNLMRKLSVEGVAAAYELTSSQGTKVLTLECFGGTSLNRLKVAGTLSIHEWLSLAIHIADCLGQLHRYHIVHKDINPSNIVWNRTTGQLKLIDLGNATELAREVLEGSGAQHLEGTLAYLSPEQTGRMNRAVDYRTDFYSLGVTLYELLTGRLPFASKDILELVHAHIAKTPKPVNELNPVIPAAIAAIIAKLMAKMAEDRYQSASGLKADLELCLAQLNTTGEIAAFPLGRHDFSARLQISQKLYNRAGQIDALLSAFDRAATGQLEVMLVAGYSGIGKTALVHELQKPVTQHRGYFLEGKFQQFKRDVPYAALIQSFTELIRQILMDDETVIQHWKEKLLQYLGGNAQVIIDVIPEMEFIVGPQPAAPVLAAEQARNRFQHAFQQFVAAIASAEHPLVLFIDDLQWADLPSLQLLSALARGKKSLHLLLIGAYRDNEVTDAHPLSIALDEMARHGTAIHSVTLPPLALGDVTELLRDTLQDEAAEVDELAQLCLAKTQGNPFFLNRFLETLVEQGMLYRDGGKGGWRWDIAAIRQADITDNVVDLMLAKLQKLPAATQRVLQGAACLGTVFDLRMLAMICGLTQAATADLLWEALHEDVIVPLNGHYKYVGQAFGDMAEKLSPTYRFLHDRVQQAADLLSSDADKASLHLSIGRLWRKTLSPAAQQEQLFDLVNHLNFGLDLTTDEAERLAVATLNLTAARKAKASTAYKPALTYLQTGLALVAEHHWQTDYDLMLALHLEAAETSYLTVDFAQMEQHVQIALRHVVNLLDRVKLQEIPMHACITQSRLQEALALGLQILRQLGVRYPDKPNTLHLLWEAMQTRWAMRNQSAESLVQLPLMTDDRTLAIRRITSRIGATFHRMLPLHFALTHYKGLRMAVKYGVEPSSSVTFHSYAVVLHSVWKNTTRGMLFGDIALRLLNRFGRESNFYWGRTTMTVQGFLRPWTTPLHQTIEPLTQAYLHCMEMGDPEFAAHAANLVATHALHSGVDLPEVEKKTASSCRAVEQLHGSFYRQRFMWKHILELMGRSSATGTAEEVMTAEQEAANIELMKKDPSETGRVHSLKLMVSYLRHDYDAALDHAEQVRRTIHSQRGLFIVAIFHFYDALVQLATLDSAAGVERTRSLRRVRKDLKKLRQWGKNAPANFSSKCALIEAELARCTGDALQAIEAYESAIELATQHNLLHECALAKELAGAFYLGRSQHRIARAYLQDAHHDYHLWGALAKVDQLERRYPRYFHGNEATRPDFSGVVSNQTVAIRAITTVTGCQTSTLDLTTVMRASQALSQEIVLERLLKQLMQVVIENAGAQRGVLLLKENDRWMLEAEQSEGRAEAEVLQSMPLDESNRKDAVLPLSLVHYIARTKESIVIRETTEDKLLKQDPYVQRCQPRSILCMPILHHAELTGMLYLENNALSGAFTENHLEVLNLLASQIAISIDNARLYADMEERVAARTAELKAMTLRDGLTGVGNRKAFDERLAEELARSRRTGQPLALLMIDVDHFKRVNDDFGHLVGDECLKRMGSTLLDVPHRPSDFVARYGGEEFAVLMPDTDLEGAIQFAERVLDAVRTIVLGAGHARRPITASIGVAVSSHESPLSADALIANADRRLYLAKTSGRNRVVGVN